VNILPRACNSRWPLTSAAGMITRHLSSCAQTGCRTGGIVCAHWARKIFIAAGRTCVARTATRQARLRRASTRMRETSVRRGNISRARQRVRERIFSNKTDHSRTGMKG